MGLNRSLINFALAGYLAGVGQWGLGADDMPEAAHQIQVLPSQGSAGPAGPRGCKSTRPKGKAQPEANFQGVK